MLYFSYSIGSNALTITYRILHGRIKAKTWLCLSYKTCKYPVVCCILSIVIEPEINTNSFMLSSYRTDTKSLSDFPGGSIKSNSKHKFLMLTGYPDILSLGTLVPNSRD